MLLRLSFFLIAAGVVISVISASLLGMSVYFTTVNVSAEASSDEQQSVTIRQLAPLEDVPTTERTRTTPTTALANSTSPTLEPTSEAAEPATPPEFLSLAGADEIEEKEDDDPQLTRSGTIAPVMTPSAVVITTPPNQSAVLSKTDVLTGLTQPKALSKTDVISIAAIFPSPTPPTIGSTAESAFIESTSDESISEAVTELEYNDPYTSTDQVQPPPSADPTIAPEEVGAVASTCSASSSATFDLIPIEGRPLNDHPAYVHGDLNLALRGYIPVGAPLGLVDYSGATDGDAPQLHGLFEPNRVPEFSNTYRVNDWLWDSSQCGGHPRGCPGPPADTFWPVTMVGVATSPGEPIYIPERGAQIYGGGYTALVLYAEQNRITLGYTRRDTVADGYTVHIENVCINPNLVALYKAQEDADGWLATGHLPALRNNQSFGTALGHEIQVAIRDVGTFMDPRSQKDWWR